MRTRTRSRTGRVRIEDVALHAGVSPMTVSRALHRPELLSQVMHARVMDAIRVVGYTPDLVAQSLASNRTGMVAAVIPTLANPLFSETLDGIQEALAPRGYHLILATSHYIAESEESLIAALLGRRPDGMILVGVTHTHRTRTLLRATELPVVELWDLTDRPIDMLVGFSNLEAARAMVAHLVAAGRRHIVHVTSSASDKARASGRRRGYEMAMRQFGLGEPWTVDVPGPGSYACGAETIHQLRRSGRKCDALFFADDVMAAGAALECEKLGIAVPGQLGIAGFGDTELSARLRPSLTTVRIERGEMGRSAGELLVLRMDGEAVPNRIIDVGFSVVVRESA